MKLRGLLTLTVLAGVLLVLATACEEQEKAEPTPKAAVEARATDTPAPLPTDTPLPPEPTNTPVPPEPTDTPLPPSPVQQEQPPPSAPQQANCHPSYEGACLDPNCSDYDCAGGSGNGPCYTGRVRVVGPDVYDLDRDNDGIGCE